jgi:hypothetical protein
MFEFFFNVRHTPENGVVLLDRKKANRFVFLKIGLNL